MGESAPSKARRISRRSSLRCASVRLMQAEKSVRLRIGLVANNPLTTIRSMVVLTVL